MNWWNNGTFNSHLCCVSTAAAGAVSSQAVGGGRGAACAALTVAAVSARQRWYLLLWPDSRTSRSYSGLQIHTYSAGIKIVKYVNVVDMFQGALLALLKLEIF